MMVNKRHKILLIRSQWRVIRCRVSVGVVLVAFIGNGLLFPVCPSAAQEVAGLPAPGVMVEGSSLRVPVIFKGMRMDPAQPLQFDFLMDTGNSALKAEALRQEALRLIRYFLASLAVPENDLWVNLSPYEGDRIIPEAFGRTEMGRDLLAQDYMLKQLSASLLYPEKALGRQVWKKIYALAGEKYQTTRIPVETFNKVWIVPDEAVVYVSGDKVLIVRSHLKVMLEADYLAMNQGSRSRDPGPQTGSDDGSITRKVIREVVLPALETEVNSGENFCLLRQIYHAMILSTWFKRHVKDGVLGRGYSERNKVGGIDLADKEDKNRIWKQYVKAYKKGVFNYVKEETDEVTHEVIPRKYFSGGFHHDPAMVTEHQVSGAELAAAAQAGQVGQYDVVTTRFNLAASGDFGKREKNLVPHPERKALLQAGISRLETLVGKINKENLPVMIFFGDKHGQAEDLRNIVYQAEVFVSSRGIQSGKKMTIVGHGDAFDRGTQNVEVFLLLKRLKEIEKENPGRVEVHLLWGNHDVLFMQAVLLDDRKAMGGWLSSGGGQTYMNFQGVSMNREDVAVFMLENFELYYVDEWGILHVHAGIPMDKDGVPGITIARLGEWQHELNVLRDRLKAGRKEFLANAESLKKLEEFFQQKELLPLLWVLSKGWLDYVADPDNQDIIIDQQNKEKVFSLFYDVVGAFYGGLSAEQRAAMFAERWKDFVLAREDFLRERGVRFDIITKEKKISRSVLDNFMLRLGVNGVVFGHIHQRVNIDNKIVGIDVEDDDPGHFMLDDQGLGFNSLRRGQGEPVVSLSRYLDNMKGEIASLKEQLSEVEPKVQQDAAQEVGGIALKPGLLRLQETGGEISPDGAGGAGRLEPARIDGLSPVILGIVPLSREVFFRD